MAQSTEHLKLNDKDQTPWMSFSEWQFNENYLQQQEIKFYKANGLSWLLKFLSDYKQVKTS